MKKWIVLASVCSLVLMAACSLPIPMLSPSVAKVVPADQNWELITSEDAQGIALDHAKLTEDKVSSLCISFGVDDDCPEYEVSFIYNDLEYDYQIHGESGRIMYHKRDKK